MASKKGPNFEVAGDIVAMPLSVIIVPKDWNTRSGNWEKETGKEDDENDTSFLSLKESIKVEGQDTPITVRPDGKGKYIVVEGFRRHKAVEQLATEAKTVNPTINVVIRELSEAEAVELNVRENAGRDNLKGADLAYGAFRIFKERAKVSKKPPTDSQIAAAVGKSQPYITRLLTIMKGISPEIATKWRSSPIQLSIEDMLEIANLGDAELQAAEYEKRTKGRTGGKPPKDPNAPPKWLDEACKKAYTFGTMLAKLQKEGVIKVGNFDFKSRRLMSVWISLPDKVTDEQSDSIGKAAKKAFDAANSEAQQQTA